MFSWFNLTHESSQWRNELTAFLIQVCPEQGGRVAIVLWFLVSLNFGSWSALNKMPLVHLGYIEHRIRSDVCHMIYLSCDEFSRIIMIACIFKPLVEAHIIKVCIYSGQWKTPQIHGITADNSKILRWIFSYIRLLRPMWKNIWQYPCLHAWSVRYFLLRIRSKSCSKWKRCCLLRTAHLFDNIWPEHHNYFFYLQPIFTLPPTSKNVSQIKATMSLPKRLFA